MVIWSRCVCVCAFCNMRNEQFVENFCCFHLMLLFCHKFSDLCVVDFGFFFIKNSKSKYFFRQLTIAFLRFSKCMMQPDEIMMKMGRHHFWFSIVFYFLQIIKIIHFTTLIFYPQIFKLNEKNCCQTKTSIYPTKSSKKYIKTFFLLFLETSWLLREIDASGIKWSIYHACPPAIDKVWEKIINRSKFVNHTFAEKN